MSVALNSVESPIASNGETSVQVSPSEVRQGCWLWLTAGYTAFVIIGSIVMFLANNTSGKICDLIEAQNIASTKLWDNLDYYQHHHINDQKDTSLPPGLYESLVEFSMRNVGILENVHRLTLQTVLQPHEKLIDVIGHIPRLVHSSPPPPPFDHLGIDPRISSCDSVAKNQTPCVVEEGMYQIELYQAISGYAADKSSFYKDVLAAASVYATPVFYALLGSFLWDLRATWRQDGKMPIRQAADRKIRFVISAIIGFAISAVGAMLPKEQLLSPTAIAFVFGYSVDIFISRLDAYLASVMRDDTRSGREPAAAGARAVAPTEI